MGRRCLAAVLTATLAGGSTFAARAPEATRALSARKTVRLEFTSKLQNAQAIDNPPTGPSAGDVLLFTEDLLDATGATVGRDAAVCTRLFDATLLCNGVYVLAGGQIMVQLLQPGFTGTYDQPITGGTGRFAGATETVTVIQGAAAGGGDRFVFRLWVPKASATRSTTAGSPS